MDKRKLNQRFNEKRKSRNIAVAIKNLILCCGENTEIQYFEKVCEEIKKAYPKETGIKFDIILCALDPLKMAETAEERCEEAIKNNIIYQHIWVVFDKDDFERDNFDNSINKLGKLCSKYKQSGICFHALWSNECIELWFLLHFNLLSSNIPRKQYFEKIGYYLKEKYEKKDKNIAEKIKSKGGNIKKAIENADRLLVTHKKKTPSHSTPATNVVEFFKHYKDYLDLH